MISLGSIALFLFGVLSITYKDWLGWGKIATATSDLIAAVLITGLIVFLLIDFLMIRKQEKIFSACQGILFCFIILIMVGMPLLSSITTRRSSVNYLFIHDGALQTEIATRFLLKGKNPYATSYFGTPLESWQYGEPDHKGAKNPALYHYVYLPFVLITSTAGHLVQKTLLGWEDLRFTLFTFYLGMIAVVWILVKNMKDKYLYLTLLALNPLTIHFLIEGRNDIVAFFFLLTSAFFLYRRNMIISAIFLAFSVTFKQTNFLAAPFFLWYVFSEKEIKPKALRYTAVFLGVTAAIILPFFFWNPKNFWDATIGYMNGTALHSYPIKSIGFAQFLMSQGIIKDSHNYFPFWILQTLSVISLLVIFLRKLNKGPKISLVFLFFSITLLIFLYFSRVFSDSYLILVFLSLTASLLFYQKENSLDGFSFSQSTRKPASRKAT